MTFHFIITHPFSFHDLTPFSWCFSNPEIFHQTALTPYTPKCSILYTKWSKYTWKTSIQSNQYIKQNKILLSIMGNSNLHFQASPCFLTLLWTFHSGLFGLLFVGFFSKEGIWIQYRCPSLISVHWSDGT